MAGFFGFFDYSKPGPGVPKNAPPKSRFVVFFEIYFRKFSRLVTLNMLYALACLPLFAALVLWMSTQGEDANSAAVGLFGIAYLLNIFTLGPATAGFTYVLRNFTREEHAWVWSDFKEHFVKNYKQALLMSLIDLVLLIAAYVNYNFYIQLGGTHFAYGILKYVFIVLSVFVLMMHFYIYPMMVTFKLSLPKMIRNSFIFTIITLPQTFALLLVCAFIIILCAYYYVIGLILTFLILPSTIGLIINYCVWPTIKKYMIDNMEPQEGQESQEDKEGQEDKENIAAVFTEDVDKVNNVKRSNKLR